MKEEKIRMVVVVTTIFMVVILFGGITYSYFTALNNKGSTSVISATSGKMVINYADGSSKLLSSENIQPSNKILIDKTFTLTGTNTTSGLAMPYKVGLNYVSEFSDGQIHYYIKRMSTNSNITSKLVGTANQTIPGNTTETGYTTGTVKKGNRYLELATGEFKANTSNQTITFNLKIQFPDTGENQDIEKGKTLTGEIVVNYEESATDTLIALYDKETKTNNISTSGLFIDDTKDVNLRYTGATLNNYVIFGNDNELWRIVGIFNITDSDGNTTRKLKIVRDSALGAYSWDSKLNSETNDYRGINDWTDADLMKELNGDYLDTTLTANKTNWYNSTWDLTTRKPVLRQTGVFDYTTVIKQKYQNMISNSVWNIGGNGYTGSAPYTLNLLTQYNRERNTITYQNSRPTTWTGKVGLIYASDYGYASTYTECHNNLRAGVTYDKDSDTLYYANGLCKKDNWLYKSIWYWTISSYSNNDSTVYHVYGNGAGSFDNVCSSTSVFPSIYLKSNIKIASGTGEKSNPYILNQ